MKIEILKRNKKQEIEGMLYKNFDLKIKIPFILIKQSKEKIRIFTGNLSSSDLIRLAKILTIDSIGLYFAFLKEHDFRLSFDAAILYGKDSKEFIEINSEEAKLWLSGKAIEKNISKNGYFLIKHNNDILGCGKLVDKKILNFVPKERRIL